jgi:hypothetical protein
MFVVVFNSLRIATWLILLVWISLLALRWLMMPQSSMNGMTQCALAAQEAALSVMGYAVARSIVEMLNGIEAMTGQLLKPKPPVFPKVND